jgi:hypothetical protein
MTKRIPSHMKKIADKGSSEAFLRAHSVYSGDECLIWPYKTVKSGYGLATVGGVQKRASRWMCIIAHGEPCDETMHAAHNCGNPSCVNPKHLRWATPKENANDRLIHGTHNRGERNGKTTLTDDQVREIRTAAPNLKDLVERYGVSKGCISKIRSMKRWAHVQ